jgi:anti-sigma B factor antagonist
MHIDQRPIDDVVVLDLHGKIAVGDGDVLIKDTIQRLAGLGARKIVLNFADVTYMDSVGLSTIIRAHLTLRQDGGQLRLLQLPPRIAGLLAITRLTTVFDTFDDEAAAIRSFARAGLQVPRSSAD